MGTIYIGTMQLRYDVSGGTELKFSDGERAIFLPDYRDVSLYLHAEAMGYGRQVGPLTRDRVLMHCLIGMIEGYEPKYLMTDTVSWFNRVDALVCALNQVKAVQQPWGPVDEAALVMAESITKGSGYRV